MSQDQLQKLQTFEENENLAIFDELNELNTSIRSLIDSVKDNKIDIPEAKDIDLSSLDINFDSLKESVESVTASIKAQKTDIDLSGVERLLNTLVSKEVKELDLSVFEGVHDVLEEILLATQTTASATNLKPEKQEKLVPELKTIQKVLDVLNDNLVDLEIPEFDYEKLGKIIKKNLNISVGSSGGGASILKDDTGATINPATREAQGSLDAFTRLRTSGTDQRLDIEWIMNKQDEIMDEVIVGTGSVTHNANERDLTLAVGSTTDGDEASMYSYDVPYTAGNSQLIYQTG